MAQPLNIPFQYARDDFLPVRFLNHAVLSLKTDLGARDDCPKNLAEKIGDIGLWIIEEFPLKIWAVVQDPKVVTVALTALALVAVSFAFYPAISLAFCKAAVAALPLPPLWAVKFGAYLATCAVIIAAALRAEGRFWNDALMAKFYNPRRE